MTSNTKLAYLIQVLAKIFLTLRLRMHRGKLSISRPISLAPFLLLIFRVLRGRITSLDTMRKTE